VHDDQFVENVAGTQGHSRALEFKGVFMFLSVLHCNCLYLVPFWNIQRQIIAWPWNLG